MSDPIDVQVDTAFGLGAEQPGVSPQISASFDELLRQQRQIVSFQMDSIEQQIAAERERMEGMVSLVLKLSEEQTRLTVQKLDGMLRLFERMGLVVSPAGLRADELLSFEPTPGI